MAPPIPPPAADADLADRDVPDLLGLVGRLTNEIEAMEVGLQNMRVRRTRAFRELRDRHEVSRVRIGDAAKLTPGGVGNLIADLNKREAQLPSQG
jgi:hypothetical protein